MKRLFVSLLALAFLLVAVPAQAGMNIRQNDDGSTDWVDATGNAFNVGAAYITVYMSDVGNSDLSGAVAVPIPNAKVTLIQTTILSVPAGADTVLKFYAGTGLTAGSVATTNEISNGTSPLTITQSGGAVGDVDTLTPTTQNGVTTGDVIIITTDGGDTGDVPVMVTITIEPDGD